mmetsp:Transcript_78548/g.234130  ORF Transcript_78548/g.234130 Transcript_78548/m.234130 type:complete len:275 (+) Transcript_78548:657-1481(+)
MACPRHVEHRDNQGWVDGARLRVQGQRGDPLCLPRLAGGAAGPGARRGGPRPGGDPGAPRAPGRGVPHHLRGPDGRLARAVPLPAVGEVGGGGGPDPLRPRGPRGPLRGPRGRLACHRPGGLRRALGRLEFRGRGRGRAPAEGGLAQRARLGPRGERLCAPRGQHLRAEAGAPATVGPPGVLPGCQLPLLERGAQEAGEPEARGGPRRPRHGRHPLARGRPEHGDAQAWPLRCHGGAGLVGRHHDNPVPQGRGDVAAPSEHHAERAAECACGRL